MKSAFNLAKLAGPSALAIGLVLHQYGTSYKEACKESLGSSFAARVAETVTGKDLSSGGQWHSVSGSAFCDGIGAIEKPVVKFANNAMKLITG